MQFTDQTLLVFSDYYTLWKELAVLYYVEEHLPHSMFCRGLYASNDRLHGLHGYLECT